MAKQTKATSAPQPQTDTTNATAPAPANDPAPRKGAFGKPPGDKDTFVRVLDAEGNGVPPTTMGADGKAVEAKLAPQAKVIINLIEAAGANGISRKELCEKLPAAGLVTRQPVGRIVSYYQKEIIQKGCVTLTKIA